jgi:hypothetical protein
LIKSIQTPFRVAIISTILCLISMTLYLSKYNYKIGALFATPKYLAQQIKNFPPNIPVFEKSGHDGALIWSVARSPLNPNIKESGHHFERFLFPMTNYLFALGNEKNLIWSTPLVNVLSTFLISYLCAILLIKFGHCSFWAILISLGPSSIMALRFNLSNQFYMLLCIYSFYNYLNQRPKSFALSSALAFCVVPLSFGINLVAAFIKLIEKKKFTYVAILPIPIFLALLYKIWLKHGLGYDINYLFNDALGNKSIFHIPLRAMFKGSTNYLNSVNIFRKIYYFGSYLIFLYFLLVSSIKLFLLCSLYDLPNVFRRTYSICKTISYLSSDHSRT